MHVFNYNRINNFLNWLFNLIEWFFVGSRPRVGDWYLTDWEYDNRIYDGVYVVESVSNGLVKIRYCGLTLIDGCCFYSGDRSENARTFLIAGLNSIFTRVTVEEIESFDKTKKIEWIEADDCR